MDTYYILLRYNLNNGPTILNFTSDYYYARRLYKKYKNENKNIYFKSIAVSKIIENSTYTR